MAASAIETKLYVTNFPSSATRQQLQQFFSRFGRVQECAIMWNSYAFVHYASMDEARRALEQSNGAMFLNRKLIVQLSTSRFRPQPKEANISILQPPKQLMIMGSPTSLPYHLTQTTTTGGGGGALGIKPSQYSFSDLNYELMPTNNSLHQPNSSSSPIPDTNHFFPSSFRSPSPAAAAVSQDINQFYSPYASVSMDRMTPSSLSLNPMKSSKTIKSDTGINGEIPKLYCTNLPDNCKAHDLQRLFSSFGQVVDCVILWDYYAFVTYKSFNEAERALLTLNDFSWKDRRLIVEWSRASGRRQHQPSSSSPSSPPPRRLGSFTSDASTPSSPRSRPSNGASFYGNSASLLSSHLPHHSFNQNLTLMSIMQQQHQHQPYLHQHHQHQSSNPYAGNHLESISTDNHRSMFNGLTNSSSSNHRLDLSPFIDTDASTSNGFFSSPDSPESASNIYQPSDIVALLESSNAPPMNRTNNSISDITNTLSASNSVPPSCSSAAAAGAAALYQENLLSSLFSSFEPFSKFSGNDDPSKSFHPHFSASPLLTTAPDHSHYPLYYGHNISSR